MKNSKRQSKLGFLLLMFLVFVSGIIFFFCLATIGCRKGDSVTGVTIDSATVLGITLYRYYSFAAITCEDSLDPDSIDICKALNGDSILFARKWQNYSEEVILEDTSENLYGTSYTFTLISNIAHAEGTIMFPELPEFTFPSQYDTFQIEDIQATWTECDGADNYLFIKQTLAYDSTGLPLNDQIVDTVVVTPSITLSAENFNIIGAAYYVVDLFARPSASEDMAGNILGYLAAVGDFGTVSFYVVTHANASRCNREALFTPTKW
jgi:hypothetical protein